MRICPGRIRAGIVGLILATLSACGGGNGNNFMGGGGGGGGQTPPPVQLTRLSTDNFTNPQSQHATEVEPSMAAAGSTLVAAFQVGRIFSGGGADIGFATSTDAGATWTSGLLPGITQVMGGQYSAVSDASVAFDQAHGVWIISSLAIGGGTDTVIVSRSTDARTWGNPIVVSMSPDSDKNWIACDNNSSSPYFGHCYLQWDDPKQPANGLVWMSTSTDGGATWSAAVNTADMLAGLSGQPVVSPDGTVIVPIQSADGRQMLSFSSSDGGATWSRSVVISAITDHAVAGGLRTSALPSATIDAAGRVYVVWQDCRFRANCTSNDIVMSTSSDGATWTAPVGIPIDATSSTVDHFIPVIAVDPGTSGGSARLALTYYFYPTAGCAVLTCQLEVGVISSGDGGNTWGSPTTLAGPMTLSWLPNTSSGVMVADYIAAAFSNGQPRAVFAVAQAKTGTTFNQAIYTTTNPLPLDRLAARPVMAAHTAVTRRSDHGARKYFDLDHEHPRPPEKRRR